MAAAEAMAAIVVVEEGDEGSAAVVVVVVVVVVGPELDAPTMVVVVGETGLTLASLPALDRPVRPKKLDPNRIFSERLLIILVVEEDRGRPFFITDKVLGDMGGGGGVEVDVLAVVRSIAIRSVSKCASPSTDSFS